MFGGGVGGEDAGMVNLVLKIPNLRSLSQEAVVSLVWSLGAVPQLGHRVLSDWICG